MRRAAPLALLAALLTAAGCGGGGGEATRARARIPIRIGIGDQQVAMYDQPAFQRLHLTHARFFVPWNVMDNPGQLATATQYAQRARKAGFSLLLHISTDNYTIKKARLPSLATYTAQVRRLVKYFRGLGVADFGVWDEVNHASQPTYRSPARAAQYFEAMYDLVKPNCPSCGVVALDVLDQVGVEKYMSSFFAALSPSWRRRATTIGIHNYGDVNRRRTTFTRRMIDTAHRYVPDARFWITETGGIVKLGRSFPCSTARAANRTANMFSLARMFQKSGVERMYVYNWTGVGCGARFDAGLTEPDGTPRPAYAVLQRQLANYER